MYLVVLGWVRLVMDVDIRTYFKHVGIVIDLEISVVLRATLTYVDRFGIALSA